MVGVESFQFHGKCLSLAWRSVAVLRPVGKQLFIYPQLPNRQSVKVPQLQYRPGMMPNCLLPVTTRAVEFWVAWSFFSSAEYYWLTSYSKLLQ